MSLLVETRRSMRRLSWASIVVLVMTSVTSASLFSVVDPLLLAPLPFERATQLITLAPSLDLSRRLSASELARATADVRESPLLESVSYVRPGFGHELPIGSNEQGIRHYLVGSAFLDTLGIRDVSGTPLSVSDVSSSPPAVMLRQSLADRLGGDELLNRVVSLGNARVRVAAVIPTAVAFPPDGTVWSAADAQESEKALPTLARMRAGVTIAQVRSRFPGLVIRPFEDHFRPRQQMTLWLVMGSATAMALIGWLQLSALQLSRLTARSRELAIRAACGASVRRVRAELAMDATAHAIIALPIVLVSLPAGAAAVAEFTSASFPHWNLQGPGSRSYLFAGVTLLGAATAAHVAALTALEGNLSRVLSLRQSSASSLTPSLTRTRSVLLFVQVAFTASVLYGTTLAALSFAQITATPLGFDPRGVVGITPRSPEGTDITRRLAHRARLELTADRIRAVPGVLDVARGFRRPLQAGAMKGTAQIPSRPECARRTVRTNYVDSRYFRTLSIAVLDGRVMAPSENAAVIDERLAREFSECGADVGDLVQVTAHRVPIVGVVSAVAENLGGLPVEPVIYLPDVFGMADTVFVRTDGSKSAVSAASELLEADIDGSTPPTVVVLLDDWKRHAAPARARLALLIAMAVLSGVLAVTGIAGSVIQFAQVRRRELAIRMALGASPAVMRRGLAASVLGPVLGGSAAGGAAGVALSRVAAAYWPGVRGADVSTAAALAMSFAVVGLLAAAFPLRRALASAPMSLLRND